MQVCAEALALMTRLAPLIVSHGKSPDCTRLLQLLLPFARRATTAEQRVVVQAITSLVPFGTAAVFRDASGTDPRPHSAHG